MADIVIEEPDTVDQLLEQNSIVRRDRDLHPVHQQHRPQPADDRLPRTNPGQRRDMPSANHAWATGHVGQNFGDGNRIEQRGPQRHLARNGGNRNEIQQEDNNDNGRDGNPGTDPWAGLFIEIVVICGFISIVAWYLGGLQHS
ncbi:hypothetical protein AAE478_010388 [Parahypoxylon ruwenzoriense]